MLSDDFIRQLVEMLKKVDPHKIILFGSHAYGDSDSESDVDLMVVTEDDFLPKDFAEKNTVYLRVSNSITDLEKKIPIDLIVHTKAMHREFMNMGIIRNKIATEDMV